MPFIVPEQYRFDTSFPEEHKYKNSKVLKKTQTKFSREPMNRKTVNFENQYLVYAGNNS